MKRNNYGFTIIELLVVIIVIGILATISVVGFTSIQQGARNTQRSAQLTSVAESLEKYYSKNGEYPTCAMMTQASNTVVTTVLPGLDPNNLTAPTDPTAGHNSFSSVPTCTGDPTAPAQFGYIGGLTTYTLKYKEEGSGSIKSIAARHAVQTNTWALTLNAGSEGTVSGTDPFAAYGSIHTIQANPSSGYSFGSWTGSTGCSGAASHTITMNSNKACNANFSPTPVAAPVAPTVSVATVGSTSTWTWNAATCSGGNTARYQYDYTITPAGYDSGWNATGSTSVFFTTSTEGQTYTVAVKAQCYNAAASSSWSDSAAASYIRPLSTWQQVAAGALSGCGIAYNNLAYCWGDNTYGQLGNNSNIGTSTPVAVYTGGVLNGKTILSITSNWYSTCVIASDNLAYCWGNNQYGQLGNNTTTNSNVPVAVDTSGVLSGKTIKSISTGGGTARGYTCAIASDDKAYCWGYNLEGQLGNNTLTSSSVPVAVYTSGVLSGLTIKSILAGGGGSGHGGNSCAIASNNLAYCWGDNTYGQLGDNSTTDRKIPVAVYTGGVLSGLTIKSISAGGFAWYNSTCAIASNNLAYCWGYNGQGELGDNSTTNRSVPVAVYTSGVLSGKTIKFISSAGGSGNGSGSGGSSCAIASDDKVYCWGINIQGELGDNSTTNRSVPVAVYTSGVLSGKTVLAISLAPTSSCALASDNNIYCWGSGNFNSYSNSLIPVAAYPPYS